MAVEFNFISLPIWIWRFHETNLQWKWQQLSTPDGADSQTIPEVSTSDDFQWHDFCYNTPIEDTICQ